MDSFLHYCREAAIPYFKLLHIWSYIWKAQHHGVELVARNLYFQINLTYSALLNSGDTRYDHFFLLPIQVSDKWCLQNWLS